MQTETSILGRHWREWILVSIILLPMVALMATPPIAQDLSYHDFADQRTLFGIPNFANVLSNFPFLIVGLLGLALCAAKRKTGAYGCWAIFFFGVALVTLGSGWYHATPDSATLVWDRLPMTIAFMGLLVAVLAEQVKTSFDRFLLLPAIAIGVASVLWWHYTDDLRLYVWVQFGSLLAIAVAVLLFPKRYTHSVYLLYGLSAYFIATVAETIDRELFAATGDMLSGHSLKHLLSALACLIVYFMLRIRRPVTHSQRHRQR
jgi:hypothetical protein